MGTFVDHVLDDGSKYYIGLPLEFRGYYSQFVTDPCLEHRHGLYGVTLDVLSYVEREVSSALASSGEWDLGSTCGCDARSYDVGLGTYVYCYLSLYRKYVMKCRDRLHDDIESRDVPSLIDCDNELRLVSLVLDDAGRTLVLKCIKFFNLWDKYYSLDCL